MISGLELATSTYNNAARMRVHGDSFMNSKYRLIMKFDISGKAGLE